MTISTAVARTVNRFSPGQVFGYRDIDLYPKKPMGVVQAINRLVKKEEIKRISKGKFYKPKQGLTGFLRPGDTDLLKAILDEGDGLRGYVTGPALYNQLGLTTQVPVTITVAIKGGRQFKDFGTLRVKLVEARFPFKLKTDVVLLQYLDVLKNIKKIPDAEVSESLKIMESKFADLDEKQIKRIQFLAVEYYGAQARALTGLLITRLNRKEDERLRESLNPLTIFKLGLSEKIWPEMKNWNIK